MSVQNFAYSDMATLLLKKVPIYHFENMATLGQGILRRRRVTKAYERKNCKFKGPLPPGLGKQAILYITKVAKPIPCSVVGMVPALGTFE